MSNLTVLAIAVVCHQANKAYCEGIGDNSQRDWDEALDWQQNSAVNGVQFHLDNPGAGAEASHESWLAEKTAAGWQYGSEKDEKLRTHPCCVPFAELPAEQKAKDVLFKGIVDSLRSLI